MAASDLSLTDALHRVQWARRQFEMLRSWIEAYEFDQPFDLRHEFDATRGLHRFYLNSMPNIPVEWSLQAGDILHSCRSALNYLTIQLVRYKDGRSAEEINETFVQFPVVGDVTRFDERGSAPERLSRLLEPSHFQRIRDLQPFNAYDWSVWQFYFWADLVNENSGRPNHIALGLARLSALNNIDKHRLLVAAWNKFSYRSGVLSDARVVSTSVPSERPEVGDLVAEIALQDTRPEWVPLLGDVQELFAVEVALQDDWELSHALSILGLCIWSTEWVLKVFEPVFNDPSGDPLRLTDIPWLPPSGSTYEDPERPGEAVPRPQPSDPIWRGFVTTLRHMGAEVPAHLLVGEHAEGAETP